ncbi:MAG: hypothetical protein ACI85I_002454 [Arenicella sp.]|jgi:hypothetical protein
MSNYDMRNDLDQRDYAGEIIFWEKSRKGGEVAIAVESKSDERFYQKFFHDETEFFSVDGFENVIDSVTKANKQIKGVIGIIDSDFRYFTEEQLSEAIFQTDAHDVEMQMVDSVVWENFYSQHFPKRKKDGISANEFLNNLLEKLKPLACLRYLNHTENLGLIFRKRTKVQNAFIYLKYAKFFDAKTLELDLSEMLKIVENKSSKISFFNHNPDKEEKLTQLLSQDFDLIKFSNGHDLMNVLALLINSKPKEAADSLTKQLIIAYRKEDFQETELHLQLEKWNDAQKEFSLF